MYISTYGYNIPENGDMGSIWFPALVENFERLDSHNHDGNNSPKLTVEALEKNNQILNSSNWVSVGDGTYRQQVVMPTGVEYDDCIMQFYISGGANDGIMIYPTIIRAGAGSYYLYANDNTINIRVVYI